MVSESNLRLISLPKLVLKRELVSLFSTSITILHISENYIFGVSQEGNIKIWDSQFRGKFLIRQPLFLIIQPWGAHFPFDSF